MAVNAGKLKVLHKVANLLSNVGSSQSSYMPQAIHNSQLIRRAFCSTKSLAESILGAHPYPNNHRTDGHLRIKDSNPWRHETADCGKFYTISHEDADTLQVPLIMRWEYVARSKALQDYAFMIRRTTLEALDYVKASATSADNLAAKIVLYGADGCGKSSAFVHTLHACHSQNWFVICPVRQHLWNRWPKEIAPSERVAGRVDLPQESVAVLQSIRNMNKVTFEQYGDQMRTHYTYTWGKRESTEENTPIERLIELGIERPKYANDVVGALFKEVRLHSHVWPTPTLLAVDSVNSFFELTKIFTDRWKQKPLPAHGLSLIHHMIKLINQEWRNGAMIMTTDMRSQMEYVDDCNPRHLLSEAGFNALNPFIPVEITNYDNKEFHAALDYFSEFNWLTNKAYRDSVAARKEVMFLTNNNPFFLDLMLRTI